MQIQKVISETWIFFIVGMLFAILFYSKILNPQKNSIPEVAISEIYLPK